MRNHSCRTLHQRLEDKGRVRVAPLLLGLELPLELPNTFPVALPVVARVGAVGLGAIERTPIAIGRHHLVGLEEQARVSLVKQIDVAKGYSAHRVAVVSALQGEELWLLAAARAARKFVGELERDLHRGGAVVGKEDFA